MNRDQLYNELRKEIAVNDRLGRLLIEAAKHFADSALRAQYTTNDAAALIRQAGLAEGAEKFVTEITKPPAASRPGDKH